jgi:hypothetical protein
MLLDHNKNFEGNTIFAPIGKNSEQLIFDKRQNKINIDDISSKVLSKLAYDKPAKHNKGLSPFFIALYSFLSK